MNCGIKALSGIVDLGNISALTIINLAGDNGIKLNIYKAELDDLVSIPRPAIFHSKGHFELVLDGRALPELEWTGYVLAKSSPKGKLITHQEAKSIFGGGPIGAVVGLITKAVTAVSTFVVSGGAIGPLTAGQAAAAGAISTGIYGAAAGAGIGAATGTGAGKGAILGGLTGGLAGGALASGAIGPAISNLFTGAGGALAGGTIGALTAPKDASAVDLLKRAGGGALLGGAAGSVAGPFLKGFNAAQAGSSIGQRLAAGAKTLYSGNLPTSTSASIPDQTRGALSGMIGNTPSGNLSRVAFDTGGNPYSLASGAGIIGSSNSQFNLSSVNFNPALKETLSNKIVPSENNTASKNPSDSLKRATKAGAVQLATNAFGPPKPTGINFDPAKEYQTLRNFLGDQALPAATEQELVKLVNTPLNQLTSDLSFQSDKTFRLLNQSFDRRDDQIRRSFAQAGQNEMNSSDVRRELQISQSERAQALAEAQQEIANANLGRAIQAKQFALTQSLEQGVYDSRIAMELANAIGKQAELEASIQQDDYNKFQELMAEILQIGFGSQNQSSEILN